MYRVSKLLREKLVRFQERLRFKEVYVFDLDGTLILGSKAFDGVKELLELLVDMDRRVVILSNNSSMTRDDFYRVLLDVVGLDRERASKVSIYTSVDFFIDKILSAKSIRCPYYLLPSKVVEYYDLYRHTDCSEGYDAVVVGFDRELTYEKLEHASLLLQQGIRFLVLHPDIRYPSDRGYVPDAGSIARILSMTTGREPEWIGGKPDPEMLIHAISKLGLDFYSVRDKVIYAGDRLYTDLEMARRAGVDMLLFLGGETKLEELSDEILANESVFPIESWRDYIAIVLRKDVSKA